MAGNNGLRYDGLTDRTETTTHTAMANGGLDQLFFFLLTPSKSLVIFVLAVGIIFVNRIFRPRWTDIEDQKMKDIEAMCA